MANSSSRSGHAMEQLRKFGYAFNAEGQLCKIDKHTGTLTDKPYKFEISRDHDINQEHYEQLADQIPEIVYDLLEQYGLKRTYIPEYLPESEATFFFTLPEKLVQPKKLLVLIHGSGFVRAGQWSRSLIINNSIDHGSQLPYIKKAQELGYDIVVTNTNDNYRVINGERKPIPHVGSAVDHALYVWKHYVMASEPKSVAIIAHSYGGVVTLELASRFPQFFKDKVFAIGLTDSVHNSVSKTLQESIAHKSLNWFASAASLDKKAEVREGEIPGVSAGHPKHEWTSYTAFESVFKFLEMKYESYNPDYVPKHSFKYTLSLNHRNDY